MDVQGSGIATHVTAVTPSHGGGDAVHGPGRLLGKRGVVSWLWSPQLAFVSCSEVCDFSPCTAASACKNDTSQE